MYTLSEKTMEEVTNVIGGILRTCKDGSQIPLLITGFGNEQMVTFMANSKGGYQVTAMMPLGNQDFSDFQYVVDAKTFHAKLRAFKALNGSVVVDCNSDVLILSKEDGMDSADMALSNVEVAEFTPDIEQCIANFTCDAEEFIKCISSFCKTLPNTTADLLRDNLVFRLEKDRIRMLVLGNQNAPNTLRECKISKGEDTITIPGENENEPIVIDIKSRAKEYLDELGNDYITVSLSKTSMDTITSVYSAYSGVMEISIFRTSIILSLADVMLQVPLVSNFYDGYQTFLETSKQNRATSIGVDGRQLRSKISFLLENFSLADSSSKKEEDQRICLYKQGNEILVSIVGDAAGEHAASRLQLLSGTEMPDAFITVRAKQLNTVLDNYEPSVILSFEPGDAKLFIYPSKEDSKDLRNVSLLLGFPTYCGKGEE